MPMASTWSAVVSRICGAVIYTSTYDKSRNPRGRGSNNWSCVYVAGVMASTSFLQALLDGATYQAN